MFPGYHKTKHDNHFLAFKATLALFMRNYTFDWNMSLTNQTVWLELPVVLQFPFTHFAERIYILKKIRQTCSVHMVTDLNKKASSIISFKETTRLLSLQTYRSNLGDLTEALRAQLRYVRCNINK